MVAYLDGAMAALPDVAMSIDERAGASLAGLTASAVNATLFALMMEVVGHREGDDPKMFAERALCLATTALIGQAEDLVGEADDAG